MCLLLSAVTALAAGQTRHSYDDLGRLVRVERPDGTIVTYTYDPDGNIINRTVIHDADFDGTVDAADPCTDTDGDGYGNPGFPANICAEDCAATDTTAFATPTEVSNLEVVTIPGGWRWSWDSQASTAGSGTVYDVFYGRVDLLRLSGDFSSGLCLVDGELDGGEPLSVYDDMAGPPAAGECFYYLVRAENACPLGMGSYGTANRDTTAGASPAACD